MYRLRLADGSMRGGTLEEIEHYVAASWPDFCALDAHGYDYDFCDIPDCDITIWESESASVDDPGFRAVAKLEKI